MANGDESISNTKMSGVNTDISIIHRPFLSVPSFPIVVATFVKIIGSTAIYIPPYMILFISI
jgi:hypothetical protein